MGQLRAVQLAMPGSLGLNTQDSIAQSQNLRFASAVINCVVDASGKLVSRQDFVNQTAGFSGTVGTAYTHRLDGGTELLFSASAGQIYSGLGTLTSRFDYRQGAQIVDVGGAKAGATATGLADDATTYGIIVTIDAGAPQQITVTGSAAQTYTTLLAEIDTDLSGATCTLVGGNLKFISDTTGATSLVSIDNSAGTASVALLSTLTSFVSVYTAAAGTATQTNWQFATLNSRLFAFQAGQTPTCLLESTFAVESLIGKPWSQSPNVVMAALGRLWAADDTAGGNSYTVWWSNLLDGKTWNTGDAGSLSLKNVWPSGHDTIVAMTIFSNRLLIFGRNSLVLYELPADNDPASMTLLDVRANIGCVARDSVVAGSDGVYFLSDNGIYHLPPLALITSMINQVNKVSALVDDQVLNTYAAETMTAVRGGYYPKEGWVLMNAPVANKTFVIHTKKRVPAGPETGGAVLPVITTWTNASAPFRGFSFDKAGNFYAAGTDGVCLYTGYTPDGAPQAYSVDYASQWLNFGNEEKLKHLKGVTLTLEAASGQTGVLYWKTDYLEGTTNTQAFTCDATEFAEDPGIGSVKMTIGRSCGVAKYGFTAAITGDRVAVHALRVYATAGKTT